MNRIREAIDRTAEALTTIPQDKVDKLNQTFSNLTINELATYQSWKSAAQASGTINLDEALIVYQVLNHWDNATTAERVAVSKLMQEIAPAHVGG